MSFTPLLRRIREHKTNYRKRKGMLIGKHHFAAARISNKNVLVQILKPSKVGDEVLVSSHSRELIKYGWQGSRKNIPACYLTGLLAGAKALAKDVRQCVLYTGNRMYAPRIAASVKGLIDAGITIPVDEKTMPDQDRISGKHIADYASLLKNDDRVYNTRFSSLINAGFVPENYPDHFNEVKMSILGKPVAKKEVKKVEAKKQVAEVKPPEKKVEVKPPEKKVEVKPPEKKVEVKPPEKKVEVKKKEKPKGKKKVKTIKKKETRREKKRGKKS